MPTFRVRSPPSVCITFPTRQVSPPAPLVETLLRTPEEFTASNMGLLLIIYWVRAWCWPAVRLSTSVEPEQSKLVTTCSAFLSVLRERLASPLKQPYGSCQFRPPCEQSW